MLHRRLVKVRSQVREPHHPHGSFVAQQFNNWAKVDSTHPDLALESMPQLVPRRVLDLCRRNRGMKDGRAASARFDYSMIRVQIKESREHLQVRRYLIHTIILLS